MQMPNDPDPMFRQRLVIEGDTMSHVLEQTNRREILEGVATFRREAPPPDRPGFGRVALQIPEEDFKQLVRKYPDLMSRDAGIKSKAWLAFMQTSECEPYKLRDKI